MNSCLLKKSAGNRANRLRIMSNTLNSFRFICSGIKPLYTSSSPNLSKAPFKRTQLILVANNSQHCWMLLVASVCTPCYMLLRVNGRWCTKFETGQTFSYVQTGTSTLNTVRPTKLGVVAPVCKWLKVTDTHDKFLNCLFSPPQYCAKEMRANFAEIWRNLRISAKFWRIHCSSPCEVSKVMWWAETKVRGMNRNFVEKKFLTDEGAVV